MTEEIKVWAQMFFDDGSVSQGYRVSADIYEDEMKGVELAQKILKDLNRDEGFMVIWGAGDIIWGRFSISCPSEESSSLVS